MEVQSGLGIMEIKIGWRDNGGKNRMYNDRRDDRKASELHCLDNLSFLYFPGTCPKEFYPRGFVCNCPGEYSGPRCQLTTRTFLGNSYVWLPPKTPHNFGSVSLEFATGSSSGLLLYQGPAVEGNTN